MLAKRRDSIERSDLSTLCQIMRKEVESLYKLNKVTLTELFLSLHLGINLKLYNSSGPYLRELIETTSQFLKVRELLVLSKSDSTVSSYFLNLKTQTSFKEKSNKPVINAAFEELKTELAVSKIAPVLRESYETFLHQFHKIEEANDQRVILSTGSVKFIPQDNVDIIGLFFFDDTDSSEASDEVWKMWAN